MSFLFKRSLEGRIPGMNASTSTMSECDRPVDHEFAGRGHAVVRWTCRPAWRKRCCGDTAMRLPRFHLRTLMVITAATALASARVAPTLWLISPVFRVNSWGGGKEGIPLSVIVLDDVNGRPIAGVTVQVTPQSRPDLRPDLPPVAGITGANGVVRLTTIAKAWGRRWTADWEGSRPGRALEEDGASVDVWRVHPGGGAGLRHSPLVTRQEPGSVPGHHSPPAL